MTQPIPSTPDAPAGVPDPAAVASSDSPKRSLEDSLSSLDDSTRSFVMGQVQRARTEAQNLRERLKEAEPKLSEYERMVEATKTEQQRQAEELNRWQSEAEKWRTASVGSRIEALAAADFADPSDAALVLTDPAKYLDAGGQINDDAIRADLAAVLERKPNWRKQDASPVVPRVPVPNPAQGSSGGSPVAAGPANELAAILTRELNGSRR